MASSYVNDLRLEEIGSGEQSGTWGDTTNTNLELIAEAFSFGTEAIPTNVTNSTHTTQIADGATDPGRSMFLAYTGSQNANVTVTLAPNTVSKLWFIENATTGSSVSLIIKQGSGATITIPHGQTKAIYSDGAGTGAKIVDAFAALNVVDLTVQDDLTVTDDVAIGGLATVGETLAVTGVVTANAGVVVDTMTLDAATLTATGAFTVDAGAAINLDSASGVIDLTSAGNAFAKLDDDSGHLAIVVTQNNGDIIFKGNDDNSALTQLLKLDTSDAGSAIFGHDFYLADGQIGVFGTGNDLQIYHDGNSKIETTSGSAGDFFITAQGTGHDLYLGATDDIFIRPQGGQNGIKLIGAGAVELYHANAKKFETVSGGVTVTGAMNAATMDLSSSAVIDTTLAVGAALASGFTASVTGSVPFRAASNSTASTGTYGGVSVSRDKAGANQGTGISFHMDDDAGNITEYAYLGTVIEDDSNGAEDGSLGLFVTENSSARARVPLKVQSSGRIVISNDLPIWSGSFGGALFLKGNNASSARHFRASIVDSNGAQSGNFHLTLGNNGDVTIGDGNLVVAQGHGIDFSAQTATSASGSSATSELLDHYEEGTFTPTIFGGSTAGTYETASVTGNYTRIGNVVTAIFEIVLASSITAGGSGNMQLAGVPFPYDASLNKGFTGNIRLGGVDFNTNAKDLNLVRQSGSDSTVFVISELLHNATQGIVQAGEFSANDSVRSSITYLTLT